MLSAMYFAVIPPSFFFPFFCFPTARRSLVACLSSASHPSSSSPASKGVVPGGPMPNRSRLVSCTSVSMTTQLTSSGLATNKRQKFSVGSLLASRPSCRLALLYFSPPSSRLYLGRLYFLAVCFCPIGGGGAAGCGDFALTFSRTFQLSPPSRSFLRSSAAERTLFCCPSAYLAGLVSLLTNFFSLAAPVGGGALFFARQRVRERARASSLAEKSPWPDLVSSRARSFSASSSLAAHFYLGFSRWRCSRRVRACSQPASPGATNAGPLLVRLFSARWC